MIYVLLFINGFLTGFLAAILMGSGGDEDE